MSWLQEASEENQNNYEQIVQAQLRPGETVRAFQLAETKPPFIVRIIPFVPDLLTRAKKYILAVSEKRLLIIRITNPFNALAQPEFKEVVASIPYPKLDRVEPVTGSFTSSLTITTIDGRSFRFVDMLRSAAGKFARDVDLVRSGALPPGGAGGREGVQRALARADLEQAASPNQPPELLPGQESAAGTKPSSNKGPRVMAGGCGALIAGVGALIGLVLVCSGIGSAISPSKPPVVKKLTVAELSVAGEMRHDWVKLTDGQLLVHETLQVGERAKGEEKMRSVSAYFVPLRAIGSDSWKVLVHFEPEEFEKRFPNPVDHGPADFSSTCQESDVSESDRDIMRKKYSVVGNLIVVKPGTPSEPVGVGGSLCVGFSGLTCFLVSVAAAVGAIMMVVRGSREKSAPAANEPQVVAPQEPRRASVDEPRRTRPEPVVAAPSQKPPPLPAVPESQWYLHRGGKTYGPMTATQMRSLVHSGRLVSQDLVCQMGSQQWIRAGTAQDIFPNRT